MVLSPNDIINIKVKSPWGYKVYSSRVEDIYENEIIVAAPFEGSKIVPVELESKVIISIKKLEPKGQGRYQVQGVLKQRNSTSKVPVFHILIEGDWERIQERDFVRVDVLLDGSFTKIPDSGQAGFESTDVVIKDISGGGFLFINQEKLENNSELLFTIKLSNDTLIHCQGRVTRVKSLDDVYEYGVSFVNLDEISRQKIIQFVYKRQLDIYKKISKEQP